MLKMSKLLAGAIGAAAAVFCSTGALAEAKGSVFGDFRYGWTHFDDDGFTTGESDLGDNGSYFGIKASTGAGDITAFGTYSRVMDTDDCVNFVTGFGTSSTSICHGGTDYTREAFAGIATPYGTLAYGTQETAYSQAARRHDPFFNTGVAAVGGVGAPGFGGSHGVSLLSLPLSTLAFVGNQVTYTSPSLFGATANVAYFSNEDAAATEDPDYGIGATYSIAGIRAEAQHLRIRSGRASSTPNFLLGAGTELDATVLSVGYGHNRFGVGLTAERLDDRAAGSPDADSLQLAGWFGVVQGTRVALALSQTNEIVEGRSVTVGVFHDVTESFTAHVAAMRLEGDADNFVPDAEAFTIGASYKFDLGFSAR